MRGFADTFLLPALDKRDEEGGGVNWKCVTKLVRFIQTSNSITDDLRYSLKTRMKCKECQYVLNTLTVYYSIALNVRASVRSQMADKKFLRTFEKRFVKSKTAISPLGKASADILRELSSKHHYIIRPSALATTLYSEVQSEATSPRFMIGLEFDNKTDHIKTHEDHKCKGEGNARRVSMSCRANLATGMAKNFCSVRKLFVRGSAKTFKKQETATVAPEIEDTAQSDNDRAMEALQDVPRDCKNLQDLLSDVRVLLNRGHIDDVQLKMTVAEQLRNKCATSNNLLQDMITMRMKRVTSDADNVEKEDTDPILLSRLLKAAESLCAAVTDFEHTHQQYVRHVDDLAAERRRKNSDRSLPVGSKTSLSEELKQPQFVDGSTDWVEFVSPKTQMAAEIARASSVDVTPTAQPVPRNRPNSSLGTRSSGIICPIASTAAVDRSPPPLPIQSPFADACALLEATRPKQTNDLANAPLRARLSDEGLMERSVKDMHRHFGSRLTPESSTRSLTALPSDNARSNSTPSHTCICPALKVRFTQEHLEEILGRMGQLK